VEGSIVMGETRVAFVTGASRGIGKVIAEALIGANYTVAAGYHKTEILLNSILGDSSHFIPVHIDVASEQSVKKAIAYIEERVGSIDILINNAGIAQPKQFLDITDTDWEDMLSVNLMGAVRCSRKVIPGMIEKKNGRIINISSIGGQWGGLHQVHYAAAKAGLINFTKSMARIYSKQGITSNAVAPGLINTEMILEEMKDKPENVHPEGIPIGRLGSAQEVVAAVLFLSSLESSYITGQTINVNGGMYFG
jgi:NAD(P)-dependent dehydrogenase (short-subunit alcohol dehydrogenase family)